MADREKAGGLHFVLGTKARWGLPGGKECILQAGDIRQTGSNPGSRSSPGGGPGNPLQHSCLENPMDRESRQPIQSVELDTTEATQAQVRETVWQERWLPEQQVDPPLVFLQRMERSSHCKPLSHVLIFKPITMSRGDGDQE